MRMVRRHLVLVGSGHSHLPLLPHIDEYTGRGCEVTLISPDTFWYSGMGPGVLSETYRSEKHRVDTEKLVARRGGVFLRDSIRRIDAPAKCVDLTSGKRIRYDILSVNIGSSVPASMIDGAGAFGWTVKPIANLTRLRDAVRQHVARGERTRIIVAGGGAAGCEVAINLWHLLRKLGREREVRVVTPGAVLMENEGVGASREVAKEMERLGIEVMFRRKVLRVTERGVHLDDGGEIAYDFFVIATGVRPSSLFRDSGLPTAADGSLLVNSYLQSAAAPEIFGAGDCIGFANGPPPRVGVYAVKESKVLDHNLRAMLEDRKLCHFRPQTNYLLILNLGDRRGLLFWKNYACRTRWAFRLKNFLDCRFVGKYRR